MRVHLLTQLTSTQERDWIRFWRNASHAHPRQHPIFGEVARRLGRTPFYVVGESDGALVLVGLFHLEPLLGTTLIPARAICQRGPVFNDAAHLTEALPQIAMAFRALKVGTIHLSPHWPYPHAESVESSLKAFGFKASRARVETGLIDLRLEPQEILKSFSQSTRRKIRLAERANISIRPATKVAEAETFFRCFDAMRRERGLILMSRRDYLITFEEALSTQRAGVLLNAYHAGRFLGGVSMLSDALVAHASRFSISRAGPPDRTIPTIGPGLWWEAMKWGKARGCQGFDVCMYREDAPPSDLMFETYQFKGGFRPQLTFYLGEYALAFSRPMHAIEMSLDGIDRGMRLPVRLGYSLRKWVRAGRRGQRRRRSI